MLNNHQSDWDSSQISTTTSNLNLPLEIRLELNGDYHALSAWRQLSRYIARHPHDLRAHAQRILLCKDEALREYLPGSLQDLYLSLSGLGQSFSKNLLSRVKPALSEDDFEEFSLKFESHQEAEKYNNWFKGSVLTSGTGKGKLLVEFSMTEEDGVVEYSNALEEARSCLEYGQLDVAQEILEQELLTSPDNSEAEEELLSLYQYTRDSNQLELMTVKLTELGAELSELWKEHQADAVNWEQ